MQGKIVAYSSAVNAGYILGSDGRNYKFSQREWMASVPPLKDGAVLFIGKTGRAEQVNNE